MVITGPSHQKPRTRGMIGGLAARPSGGTSKKISDAFGRKPNALGATADLYGFRGPPSLAKKLQYHHQHRQGVLPLIVHCARCVPPAAHAMRPPRCAGCAALLCRLCRPLCRLCRPLCRLCRPLCRLCRQLCRLCRPLRRLRRPLCRLCRPLCGPLFRPLCPLVGGRADPPVPPAPSTPP